LDNNLKVAATLRRISAIFKVFAFWAALFVSTAVQAQIVSPQDIDRIRQIARSTNDPAAHELLQWALIAGKRETDFNAAAQFLMDHPGWPLEHALKAHIESLMPVHLPPQQVISWYRQFSPETGQGLILYLDALKNTGQEKEIAKVLQEVWPSLNAGLKEQSYILKAYGSYLSLALNRKRLDALLFKGSNVTAQELAGFLGRGYPELTRARIGLRNKSPGVDGLVSRVPGHLMNDPGLVYERIRWRRDKGLNDGAMELLRQDLDLTDFYGAGDMWRERHIMVRRLIEQRRFKQAYTLAAAHGQTKDFPQLQAEWVSGFIALRLLNDPLKAFPHFENLYNAAETSISKSRGAYWAGRAAMLVKGKESVAKQWLARAAAHPHTYYGQFAAQLIGQSVKIANTDKREIAPEKGKLSVLKAVDYLKSANMDYTASLFITRLIRDYEAQPGVLIYIAKWLDNNGDRTDALRVGKQLAQDNILLFPEAYPMERAVMQTGRDNAALVHAVIRQESLFDQYARSPAGAMGLMQLMPATAREAAGKLGISHRDTWLHERPEHNIRLGRSYLERMLSWYKGSVPMALAAYNAGPGRVDQWVRDFGDPRTADIAMEDWIELMPIYETRNYVQRILEAEEVYDALIR
jgi:soluble lytic murein transglycosylase